MTLGESVVLTLAGREESGSRVVVEIKRSTGGFVLAIAESFDRQALPDADSLLAEVVEQHRESVVLNLYECEYIDEAAVERLTELAHTLREQGRGFAVYVRPMSFVAFRTQGLSQNNAVPPEIAQTGEECLAERRAQRLRKWRTEKPIPESVVASVPALEEKIVPSESDKVGQGSSAGEREAFDIDLKRVSALAGKDERVIARIWATYTKFLNEGKFPVAPDGSANAQMTLDSNLVAKTLRLDPKTVRRVVEAVSTHLMEVFGSEKS